MRLQQIAEWAGVKLQGNGNLELTGVAAFDGATPSDVVFVEDPKYAEAAARCGAGAVIIGKSESEAIALLAKSKSLLLSSNPRFTFARVYGILRRSEPVVGGMHPSAVVHPAAILDTNVQIGPYVVIGPGVKIGSNTQIGPGCVLLSDISIGSDSILVSRVTVYPRTHIGDRAVIHAGAVLGSDGFGFVRDPETGLHEKFPQIGSLEVGDDVEIGANVTIDRGALATTRVANGVKLDNLVHLGHNVHVGENVVIAAQTGVSGSSVIERDAVVAGQVGIADHVRIEEGAILGAQCGVPSKKVIRGRGVLFWGTPARPIGEYLRELATLARLARKKKE